MVGVPRAPVNLDLLSRRIAVEIFADVNRRETQRTGTVAVENGFVEESPETGLDLRRAKPAAVLTIRPGRNKCGKVAVLRALVDFVLKPARIKAGELCVRKF